MSLTQEDLGRWPPHPGIPAYKRRMQKLKEKGWWSTEHSPSYRDGPEWRNIADGLEADPHKVYDLLEAFKEKKEEIAAKVRITVATYPSLWFEDEMEYQKLIFILQGLGRVNDR